jgi:hypothetical protein
MGQDRPRWAKMTQDGPRCHKMGQDGPEPIKMARTGSRKKERKKGRKREGNYSTTRRLMTRRASQYITWRKEFHLESILLLAAVCPWHCSGSRPWPSSWRVRTSCLLWMWLQGGARCSHMNSVRTGPYS